MAVNVLAGHAWGSTTLSLQVSTSDAMTALFSAPISFPADR